MLKIAVTISEEDALDFLVRNYDETKKQKTRKNQSRFFLSLFFLVLAFYLLFSDHLIQAIVFFALSLFWYFIVPYYLRSAVIRTYKEHVKNKMGMFLNKPITYELREKGVFVSYDLEEATYSYKSIDGISRAGRNIYIHHRGKVPLIVPYKENTTDIDNFIASLEERLETSDENETGRENFTSADSQGESDM